MKEFYGGSPVAMDPAVLEGAQFDAFRTASALEPMPITNFPSPRIEPLCYPGVRPEYPSFTITTSETVVPIAATSARGRTEFVVGSPEGSFNLDEMLGYYGVKSMAERVPVVGFGSNACPGQLAEKFKASNDKNGAITNGGDRQIVPTLGGHINNYAAAYSSKLGIWGYVFAELLQTPGATTEVAVNFLSPEQLKVMKASESAYELCTLDDPVSIDGLEQPIPAYAFVGKNNILLSKDKRPVLLDSVQTSGFDAPKMSEIDLLCMLSEDYGGRIEALHPMLPFGIVTKYDYGRSFKENRWVRASRLAAAMTYRYNFVRRENTAKSTYQYHPHEGGPTDRLFGEALICLMRTDGRVAENNLLGQLASDKIDIQPQTFGELYAKQAKGVA